ncbi:hypothetical protein ABW19_dt0204923 [Dactylella cylindrospora]|nr:hypothetical protein ABW19_dt0204923 [Dactylella cylindrospora]
MASLLRQTTTKLFRSPFSTTTTTATTITKSLQSRSFHPTSLAFLQVHNPQSDDSGNPLTISITPAASTRLSQIYTAQKNPNLHLRVLVESGGCHGFQYSMSLTDKIDPQDDTVFEEEETGAKVVMDLPSLELLNGSKVDYETELIGSQFKIVDNPAATSSCGCGTSFDIKF